MERYKSLFNEKAQSKGVKDLYKFYNKAHESLYNLDIACSRLYTGGEDKENDKAVSKIQDWATELIHDKKKWMDFIDFTRTAEDIKI